MTVTELRQKYPVFIYQSANWQVEGDQFKASFTFSAGEHTFHHQIALACDHKLIEKCSQAMIDQLVFSLGLVEMLSYWKAFCSPVIQVEAGILTAQQIEWWQKLLINGMGEYFFVNQIDFTQDDFVKIVASDQHSQATVAVDFAGSPSQSISSDSDQQPTFLIPIGGGKDSIVTLEILKKFQAKHLTSGQQSSPNISLLLVNPTQAARDVANLANLPAITVSRQLDPYLLDLNKQGYLNGHVPFSASLAFISVLVAYLHQIDSVALSNEASANEASLTYLDRPINHQYSKSFEFEKDFRDYLGDLPRLDKLIPTIPDGTLKQVQGDEVDDKPEMLIPISSGQHDKVDDSFEILDQVQDDDRVGRVDKSKSDKSEMLIPISSGQHDEVISTYFSLLRPLNELQIGRLFAKLGQPYFPIFRSCNRGSKTNSWCGDCPKCLFAYLMLAPWLDESTMVSIFGQNLLEKNELLPTLHALIGTTDQKPLECVGLREESLVACYLIIQQYKANNGQLPTLLSQIQPELERQVGLPDRSHHLLSDWNDEHFLTTKLENSLRSILF